MRGMLLESRVGMLEAGKVAFIYVEGNVERMRRTWEDCVRWGVNDSKWGDAQ